MSARFHFWTKPTERCRSNGSSRSKASTTLVTSAVPWSKRGSLAAMGSSARDSRVTTIDPATSARLANVRLIAMATLPPSKSFGQRASRVCGAVAPLRVRGARARHQTFTLHGVERVHREELGDGTYRVCLLPEH